MAALMAVSIAPRLCPSAAAGDKAPQLSYFDRLALANWKSLMRVDRSSKYWRPTGMLLISARPAEVMGTFMDFAEYPRFMPKVKRCKVVRKRGNDELWALVILHLPWPVANAWVAVKYVWNLSPDGAYHLNWTRHRGSMSKYWGSLSLIPWGKHWTLVVCTMQAIPDTHVSRTRLNKGIIWGTEQLLHHLRAEVDRRQARGSLRAFAP